MSLDLALKNIIANHFATAAADRARRPYSLWPSRRLVMPFFSPPNPAVYTNLTHKGPTQ